jgi:hypothetical protein
MQQRNSPGGIRRVVVLAPPPRTVYSYACLSAGERGADVEPLIGDCDGESRA